MENEKERIKKAARKLKIQIKDLVNKGKK